MKPWIFWAILSMFFAGFTSTIAKLGLNGISGELGLTVRTVFVFALILLFAAATVPPAQFVSLTRSNLLWLGLSGLTTALSWIFYYKALKEGEVATIALIDKGSILVAIVLAVVVLKEQLTIRVVLGGILMLAGMVIIARK
jgi:transporter family protein